ncbi:nuclear transport factor 2 family protein [Candidatus Palauibacter sp.]|uniref:nuclear transport factor 2 family protein n=1 Tax=Candidatus Palauibacter sp. TaxID=3101350 RepID=UPI003B5C27EE
MIKVVRAARHSLTLIGLALVSGIADGPLAAQPTAGEQGRPQAEVSAVLDALHEAASEADFNGYFSLYAREAVFLGTDATERWTRGEFMDYTRARFDAGTGWTYHMLERHITVAPGGRTAWFDERLENAGLGETRGSGVLVMEDGGWKIAQYNLTIPIPNELARDVARQIRALPES